MNTVLLSAAKGIDNIHDNIQLGAFEPNEPLRLEVVKKAENVDIDAAGLTRLRRGKALLVDVAGPHSLYVSPRDDTKAWFVRDSVLYRLNTTFTATALTTLNSNQKMSYEVVNDEIVGSNGSDIGWIDSTAFTAFSQTLGQFELAMPAGQYVAFYRGCLWVASGAVLYRSKPWNIMVRDERHSVFPMDGYIRMLAAVEDGLWIATDKHVWWLSGLGDDDHEVVMKSDFVPADGCFGSGFERAAETNERTVYWAANGFYTGKAGGTLKNHSEGRVRLPEGTGGACIRREHRGWYQYLAVVRNSVSANIYTEDTIPLYQAIFTITHELETPIISLSADGTAA